MSTIDPNLLLVVAAGVLALALLLWLLLRGRGRDRVQPGPPQTRAPLTPNKPQIDLARPVDFARAEPEPAPVAATPSPPPVAPMSDGGEADDLRRIKGLGPKLATLLASLGVTRFEQIAGWSEADIDAMDAHLGTFAGRIRRDDWVAQARLLAAGDEAGFAQRFGALGG